MQFEPISENSNSLEQSSKMGQSQSAQRQSIECVQATEMVIEHKTKISMNTIETDKCYIEDKIEQYQSKHVNQLDEQDVFSDIQVNNGPKLISAPRASAMRYDTPFDNFENTIPLTSTLPKDNKHGLLKNISHPKQSSQSDISSVTSTIGNFRPSIQIISSDNLAEMSELDKEMYRRQLKDEIQYLIKKEQKGKSSEEELALLQKNMKLEVDLHESEFQNRKLQLWILDDKYNEMKQQLKQEEDQNKRMAQMLDDLRQNIKLVREQVDNKDAEINTDKTDHQGKIQSHQDVIESQKEMKNETFQLTDEFDKEQEKLKIEVSLKDERQIKLDELLNQIKKKEKKLEKETEKKQKMYIQMRSDEREIGTVEKEIEQFNESIEHDDELRDMYETQKSFLEKQSKIFKKQSDKLQNKLDAGNQFIKYGQKNNDCLKTDIAEAKKTVNKMAINNSRLEHDILTANSSIEQSQSLIENVQKNIELIQKSKETIEKTTEQHLKFKNISNLDHGRNNGIQLEQVLNIQKAALESQVQYIDINQKSLEKNATKRSEMSTDADKTGDERQAIHQPQNNYSKFLDQEVEMKSVSKASPIKSKKSSPIKKNKENSPVKKSLSPIKKEFKENMEGNGAYSNYLMPRQVTENQNSNPMTKFLDISSDKLQNLRTLDASEDIVKHTDGIFSENINAENKVVQVLHTSVQYDMDMNKSRGYETAIDLPKQNDYHQRSHSPTGETLYQSRIGLPQNQNAASTSGMSQNTREVDQRIMERNMLQQQTADLIKKSQEKRNAATSSNGNYETNVRLVEQPQPQNPVTERSNQFKTIETQKKLSPLPQRQNSYKSNYSRFLKGDNNAMNKDIYHSAEPQKVTKIGALQNQNMYHQNNNRDANKSQNSVSNLQLGNVNKVIDHSQNQVETGMSIRSGEFDQKSGRRKSHAISDILKAKKQVSSVSQSNNQKFSFATNNQTNVSQVISQNAALDRNQLSEDKSQKQVSSYQDYCWQNKFTYQSNQRPETTKATYYQDQSRSFNTQSQYNANDYHRQGEQTMYQKPNYEPYESQYKSSYQPQSANIPPVSGYKDQETEGHEKCSLIDLSSHSLRHFNELQKQQKNFDSHSKQNDYIVGTPGIVCNESAESFVQELRDMEVVNPNGGYKMPVEHSRYNPQMVDFSYGERRNNYQQRTTSHDKPITEEGHKNFMARFATKQTDYSVRVHPQQPQAKSERKDLYQSRFEKVDDFNNFGAHLHKANPDMQKAQNVEDNYHNDTHSNNQSSSAMAYEQFVAVKDQKVEFRSKFAQKNNGHGEATHQAFDQSLLSVRYENRKEDNYQNESMAQSEERTERTNPAQNESPVKKLY